MKQIFAAAALVAGIQATGAQAGEVQQPIKPWVVDYAPTMCSASRTYGTAEKPVTLAFRPSATGSLVRVILVLPRRGPMAQHFPLSTNVSSGTTGMGLRFGLGKQEVIWAHLEPAAMQKLAAAGEIHLDGGSVVRNSRFALPGFAKVVEALEECGADLREHWNITDRDKRIAQPAKSVKPLHEYLSNDDYPSQAMMDGATGTASLALMIDETGKLSDCMVEQTSGIATLDAQSCAIFLERAKFHPALDHAGKPVRSIDHARIRWLLPGSEKKQKEKRMLRF